MIKSGGERAFSSRVQQRPELSALFITTRIMLTNMCQNISKNIPPATGIPISGSDIRFRGFEPKQHMCTRRQSTVTMTKHLLDLDVHRVDLSRAVVACHDGEPYRLVYPHRVSFSLETYRHTG